MVLDGVLAEPRMTWLGLARDKVAAFTTTPWCAPPDALPQMTVGGVVRPLPDPFPIGLAPDGSCLFLYLITSPLPTAFRSLLTRHVALLSALRALAAPPAASAGTFPRPRHVYFRTVHQVLEPVAITASRPASRSCT